MNLECAGGGAQVAMIDDEEERQACVVLASRFAKVPGDARKGASSAARSLWWRVGPGVSRWIPALVEGGSVHVVPDDGRRCQDYVGGVGAVESVAFFWDAALARPRWPPRVLPHCNLIKKQKLGDLYLRCIDITQNLGWQICTESIVASN